MIKWIKYQNEQTTCVSNVRSCTVYPQHNWNQTLKATKTVPINKSYLTKLCRKCCYRSCCWFFFAVRCRYWRWWCRCCCCCFFRYFPLRATSMAIYTLNHSAERFIPLVSGRAFIARSSIFVHFCHLMCRRVSMCREFCFFLLLLLLLLRCCSLFLSGDRSTVKCLLLGSFGSLILSHVSFVVFVRVAVLSFFPFVPHSYIACFHIARFCLFIFLHCLSYSFHFFSFVTHFIHIVQCSIDPPSVIYFGYTSQSALFQNIISCWCVLLSFCRM